MSKRKAKSAPVAVPDGILATITNAATLAVALATLTADAARILATVAWGGIFRTVSGGHVNKRGLFIASLIATLTGDGTFASLKSAQATLSVMALRAEVAYAVATGDFAYFRRRDGGWCSWATPLMVAGSPSLDATDAQYADAFERTCPTNPANVGGMLAEVTLAARRRNVTPAPIFADTVRYGAVAYYDADTHGADGYQSKGYGSAIFTLA